MGLLAYATEYCLFIIPAVFLLIGAALELAIYKDPTPENFAVLMKQLIFPLNHLYESLFFRAFWYDTRSEFLVSLRKIIPLHFVSHFLGGMFLFGGGIFIMTGHIKFSDDDAVVVGYAFWLGITLLTFIVTLWKAAKLISSH